MFKQLTTKKIFCTLVAISCSTLFMWGVSPLINEKDLFPSSYFVNDRNIKIFKLSSAENKWRNYSRSDEWKTNLKNSINSMQQPTASCINTNKLNNIDKNRIPYLVDDQEIHQSVCTLPQNTNHTYYWTDIQKDNDEGEITVTIYGRAHTFHPDDMDARNYTIQYEQHKITGFNKQSHEDIIKERSVCIYLNGHDYRIYNKSNFQFTGSGVVFKKDPKLPKYYILTAKHLFKNPVHKHGESYYSHVDWSNTAYNVSGNKNLKTHLTFGTAMKDSSQLNGYQHDYEIDRATEQTFLNNDHIKEILVVKDFSNRHIEPIKTQPNSRLEPYSTQNYANYWREKPHKQFKNLNHNYDSLTTIHQTQKVTLDAIALSVEFTSHEVDPFKHWWSTRPSKHRLLQESDFSGTSTYVPDTTTLDGQKQINRIPTNNYVYLGGYQWTRINNSFKDIAVTKGTLELSRYNFKHQNFNKYNPYGKSSNLRYQWNHEQLIGGSSGGGIFDKNLNIIGINWGGSVNPLILMNIFSWLGIDPSLQKLHETQNLTDIPEPMKSFQSTGVVYDYTKF